MTTPVDLDTLRGWFRRAPFMADLGVEPIALDGGKVSTALVLGERHLQHNGVVHAGVMTAMADHTMGAAAQIAAPDGHRVLTAELKTSLLRAAKGERLVCEARVLKPGRQLSFTEAELWTESAAGERVLVVKASATMALTKA